MSCRELRMTLPDRSSEHLSLMVGTKGRVLSVQIFSEGRSKGCEKLLRLSRGEWQRRM